MVDKHVPNSKLGDKGADNADGPSCRADK